MPEYLAPGVYVEEVDTGAKPIEGVSTSTCGVVGVAERGPVDVPVLVTSVGEYARWFGGQLRASTYDTHRFLPHAIEGLFTNGGKRVYVVRTLDSSATRAASALFDRGDASSVSTALLRAAGEGTGATASPPGLVALATTGLNTGDWLRIGEGSTAEYRQLASAPVAETVMVAIDLPLARSHATTEQAHDRTRTAGAAFAFVGDVDPEALSVVLRGASADIDALAVPADLAAGAVILELGVVGEAEYRLAREVSEITVVSGTDKTARVTLDAPLLLGYADLGVAHRITVGGTGDAQVTSAVAGSSLVFVDTKGAKFVTAGHLVIVGDGPSREIRRLGDLTQLTIVPGTADEADAGTLAEVVSHAPTRTLSAVGTTTLTLQPGEAAGLVSGQQVVVDPTGTPQTVTIQTIAGDVLTVAGLGGGAAATDEVVPADKRTTGAARVGTRLLALDDRMGVAIGSLLRVGPGATAQLVVVTSLPGQTGQAPDSGNVVVTPVLAGDVASGTVVSILQPTARQSGRQPAALALSVVGGTDRPHGQRRYRLRRR